MPLTGAKRAEIAAAILRLNPWAAPYYAEQDRLKAAGLWRVDRNEEPTNAETARVRRRFADDRRLATLHRSRQGEDAWNAWAKAMLKLRARLEGAGLWTKDAERQPDLLGTRWDACAFADLSELFLAETADFYEYAFPGGTSFAAAEFHGAARLRGAQFHGDADLEGAQFHGTAGLAGAQFHGDARLEGAQFHGTAGLRDAQFHGTAWLDGAQFHDDARLEGAQFHGTARLEGAQFHGNAWLQGAQFHGDARLKGAQFHGTAFLEGAQFHGTAFLAGAQFHGAALLRDAQFHGAALLWDAQFHGDAVLRGAQFGGTTTGAKSAYLNRAQFAKTADFTLAQINGPFHLDDAKFKADAIFKSVTSKVAFSLADATFARVPDLTEANFHQPPRLDNVVIDYQPRRFADWHGAWTTERAAITDDDNDRTNTNRRTALDRLLSRLPRPGPLTRRVLGYDDREAAARFRKLKQLAIFAEDTENTLRFHREEMIARRFWMDRPGWMAEGSGRFWLGVAYGFAADFGRSVVRPFGLWIGMLALATALLLGLREAPEPRTPALDFPAPRSADTILEIDERFPPWVWNGLVRLSERADTCHAASPDTSAIVDAVRLALRSGLPGFPADGAQMAAVYRCLFGAETGADGKPGEPRFPQAAAVLAFVHTLVSLVLVFLFGLGVRNLLKLK